MIDMIMATTPGHKELVPCRELTREEVLENYRENLIDTIYGYIETYNKINKEDILDEEVACDWADMELEAIEKETGKHRMYNAFQIIKQKYENELTFLLKEDEVKRSLIEVVGSYIKAYNEANKDDKLKKEVAVEWAEMELEDIEKETEKNTDKMDLMLETVRDKYLQAIAEL